MPSEALQQMIAAMRGQRIPEDIDFAMMRGGGARRPVVVLADDVTVERVDAGGVAADWIATPNAGDGVILHLHGGGYCVGSAESHRQFGSRLARAAAARVLMVDYRLAPEHTFPAAVDDAIAAYRFILDQGVAPESIVVSGDSAGGGLAAALVLALHEAGGPLPAALVMLSPWTDLAMTGESLKSRAEREAMMTPGLLVRMAAAYLAGADVRHPQVSPLYGDLSVLPPSLIQVGTEEILFDDAARFAERARAAGVDVTFEPCEGLFHVFQMRAPELPEAQEAIDRIGAFVTRTLAGTPAVAGD